MADEGLAGLEAWRRQLDAEQAFDSRHITDHEFMRQLEEALPEPEMRLDYRDGLAGRLHGAIRQSDMVERGTPLMSVIEDRRAGFGPEDARRLFLLERNWPETPERADLRARLEEDRLDGNPATEDWDDHTMASRFAEGGSISSSQGGPMAPMSNSLAPVDAKQMQALIQKQRQQRQTKPAQIETAAGFALGGMPEDLDMEMPEGPPDALMGLMQPMEGPSDPLAVQPDGATEEIPPGALPDEVRDDQPAMLSEGEFVVPADVVRWHGLKTFMGMREEAKAGLASMTEEGMIQRPQSEVEPDLDEIGGPPDLDMDDPAPIPGFASGGSVSDDDFGSYLNQAKQAISAVKALDWLYSQVGDSPTLASQTVGELFGTETLGELSSSLGLAPDALSGMSVGDVMGGLTSFASGIYNMAEGRYATGAAGLAGAGLAAAGLGAFALPVAIMGAAAQAHIDSTSGKGPFAAHGGNVKIGRDAEGNAVILGAQGKNWDMDETRNLIQRQLDYLNPTMDALGIRLKGGQQVGLTPEQQAQFDAGMASSGQAPGGGFLNVSPELANAQGLAQFHDPEFSNGNYYTVFESGFGPSATVPTNFFDRFGFMPDQYFESDDPRINDWMRDTEFQGWNDFIAGMKALKGGSASPEDFRGSQGGYRFNEAMDANNFGSFFTSGSPLPGENPGDRWTHLMNREANRAFGENPTDFNYAGQGTENDHGMGAVPAFAQSFAFGANPYEAQPPQMFNTDAGGDTGTVNTMGFMSTDPEKAAQGLAWDPSQNPDPNNATQIMQHNQWQRAQEAEANRPDAAWQNGN